MSSSLTNLEQTINIAKERFERPLMDHESSGLPITPPSNLNFSTFLKKRGGFLLVKFCYIFL